MSNVKDWSYLESAQGPILFFFLILIYRSVFRPCKRNNVSLFFRNDELKVFIDLKATKQHQIFRDYVKYLKRMNFRPRRDRFLMNCCSSTMKMDQSPVDTQCTEVFRRCSHQLWPRNRIRLDQLIQWVSKGESLEEYWKIARILQHWFLDCSFSSPFESYRSA